MAAQLHPVGGEDGDCTAEYEVKPSSSSPLLLMCYLPDGHDGDHYDDSDRLHWRAGERGVVIMPCDHTEGGS